jgi:pimeloyl-ACP methyl ester carboxylesterase
VLLPTIRVNTTTVDYYEAGTGLPVILIPGITEFKEEFVSQFHGLSNSYRLISYDPRRGLKRASDYTLDMLVEDLRRLMSALGLHGAVICGHSFGGLVAMEFALQYPDLAKALVLVSSYASVPHIPADELVAATSSAGHPFHRGIGTAFKLRIARLLGRKTAGTVAMEDEVSAIRTVARQAEKTSKTTIYERMKIIQKTDLRDRLPLIEMPTLVIAGAKDRAAFLSSAQQLYESIPNAALEVLEGTAHFCFLTRHDQFNTVVDDFLTSRLAEMS